MIIQNMIDWNVGLDFVRFIMYRTDEISPFTDYNFTGGRGSSKRQHQDLAYILEKATVLNPFKNRMCKTAMFALFHGFWRNEPEGAKGDIYITNRRLLYAKTNEYRLFA
jgi:hypothetical protein